MTPFGKTLVLLGTMLSGIGAHEGGSIAGSGTIRGLSATTATKLLI